MSSEAVQVCSALFKYRSRLQHKFRGLVESRAGPPELTASIVHEPELDSE